MERQTRNNAKSVAQQTAARNNIIICLLFALASSSAPRCTSLHQRAALASRMPGAAHGIAASLLHERASRMAGAGAIWRFLR